MQSNMIYVVPYKSVFDSKHSIICIILTIICSLGCVSKSERSDFGILNKDWSNQYIYSEYSSFPEKLRLEMLEKAREMFYFGYDNYMEFAFPQDELNPINCTGRGRDHDNPSNININDILGDYSLTLVDVLDTLVIIGNYTEFQRAVQLVINTVSFDKGSTVQVFEVNIRLLGALLSAHLLMVDPLQPFGKLKPDWYDNQLLQMAHDLASRLLPAFEISMTGIPYPRVNLSEGIQNHHFSPESCPAGAGSLLLEMGVLSRLLGDPVYEGYARRALRSIWNYRSKTTGLLGNIINVETGEWVGRFSGLGAGLDSFFEYLLKSYIMFGQSEDYAMFSSSYDSIYKYLRIGRQKCNAGIGRHPLFVNVDMDNGVIHNTWIDSLQASFPALQVLHGDVEEAICSHALYYFLWKKYGVLPERWDWKYQVPQVSFYPLRPELVESTYLLYQATKNPFYLHVGKDILLNLNRYTKTKCGYATVHNVNDMSLEDRMESFFLSETSKYLFLLFDKNNVVNTNFEKYIFNTEGHLFAVETKFRYLEENFINTSLPLSTFHIKEPLCSVKNCPRFNLPVKPEYLLQLQNALELTGDDLFVS